MNLIIESNAFTLFFFRANSRPGGGGGGTIGAEVAHVWDSESVISVSSHTCDW